MENNEHPAVKRRTGDIVENNEHLSVTCKTGDIMEYNEHQAMKCEPGNNMENNNPTVKRESEDKMDNVYPTGKDKPECKPDIHSHSSNGEFVQGLKDGIPIALGYFAVSFSLGITMVAAGLTAAQGTVMSLTNLTSAGEFAGVRVIAAGGTIIEMILTQLIINLRYSLMSLSLTQKLDENVKFWQKLIIAFGNTDEIFAVAMNHRKSLTLRYMGGVQILPVIGWSSGTLLGIVACNLLPERISVAMSVMLYGMFIAIVVPVAKKSKAVLIVSCTAILFSCLFRYVPGLNAVSEGISIIICTVAAAVLGAILFPVGRSEKEA